MVNVLVGGKKREDVLEARLRSIHDGKVNALRSSSGFSVEPYATYWTITGVPFGNKPFSVDMMRIPFRPKDDSNDQLELDINGWLEHNKRESGLERQFAGFCVAPARLYVATWNVLEANKDHPTYRTAIEDVRQGLSTVIGKNFIRTATQIVYYPNKNDELLEHVPDGRIVKSINYLFQGEKGPLETLADRDYFCQSLVGCTSDRLLSINRWITGKGTSVLRWSSALSRDQSRLLTFDYSHDYDSIEIKLLGETGSKGPALGMRWHAIDTEVER